MADSITSTRHGDAPVSTAKHPDPSTEFIDVEEGDELVAHTVTIRRSRGELYAFWRDFRNLALFMDNVVAVTEIDAMRSHWIVKAPANRTVEWDSLVTEDVPGEVIAWSSTGDANVRNSGRVEFREATNGRGTEVRVTIAYDPPLGELGKLVAKALQREPKLQARRELRRFKQLMEAGEIATARRCLAVDAHNRPLDKGVPLNR